MEISYKKLDAVVLIVNAHTKNIFQLPNNLRPSIS